MSAPLKHNAQAIIGSIKRFPVRWLASIVALGALAGVVLLATRPQATALEVMSPLVGKPAPQISGVSLTGTPLNLSSMRGQFVIVNFFASWCQPCFDEQPQLIQFAFDHSHNSRIIGVAFDDPASAARHFLKSTGANWPAIADPKGSIALAYGVRGPPETFVIAPSGLVVAHIDGPVTAKALHSIIARAVSEGA
jgi:cytochrome c biogenesis protein CcmG/thiol:disulfide interchange protein DsbE